MMGCAHTVEVIECIVKALTLLTDKRLYEAAVVIDADHRGDIALQLRHLSWCPRREIAEGHLVAFTDDVVQFIEHLEIDIVDLLHLALQHLWLHHRIQQHLVGTLHRGEHIHSLHQVGHTYIIMSLRLSLARF